MIDLKGRNLVTPSLQQAMWPRAHDFIYLEIRNYDKYLAQVAELYASGNSLREISRIVDLSKIKVRDLVLRAGIPLRSMRNEKGQLVLESRGKRNVKPPYGFWFLYGEVQKHPKEYSVVLEIGERWKSGQSRNSIAALLNRRGIKSPMNRKWSWNTVTNILERLKNET